MWKNKYDKLLNSNKDVKDRNFVVHEINKIANESTQFDCIEVSGAVKQLKNGKSAGLDLICAEHFNSLRRTDVLTRVFTLLQCCTIFRQRYSNQPCLYCFHN